MMRVVVFGYQKVPKAPIYAVLDKLHGEHGLHVIGWASNRGGAVAVEWAHSRPDAELTVVTSVRGPDTRFMGQFFDARAAVIACFKVYQPHQCLIFSPSYWVGSGVGRKVCQQAEQWQVPLFLFEPKRPDKDKWEDLPVGRQVELCDKKSVSGNICTRFKGHESAWHWSTRKGEKVSKFWAP